MPFTNCIVQVTKQEQVIVITVTERLRYKADVHALNSAADLAAPSKSRVELMQPIVIDLLGVTEVNPVAYKGLRYMVSRFREFGAFPCFCVDQSKWWFLGWPEEKEDELNRVPFFQNLAQAKAHFTQAIL